MYMISLLLLFMIAYNFNYLGTYNIYLYLKVIIKLTIQIQCRLNSLFCILKDKKNKSELIYKRM